MQHSIDTNALTTGLPHQNTQVMNDAFTTASLKKGGVSPDGMMQVR